MTKRKLYSSFGELWDERREYRDEIIKVVSYSNFPLFLIQVTNLMLLFYLFKYFGGFTLYLVDKTELVNLVIENENFKLVSDVIVGAGLLKLVSGDSRISKVISFKDIFKLDRGPSLLLFLYLGLFYIFAFLCKEALNYFEQKNVRESTRTI